MRGTRAILALLVALALLEVGVAWAYVAKRAFTGQPFPDLLTQYYVLQPWAARFSDQFPFPPEWWPLYVGDVGSPTVSSRWWIGDPLLGHRNAKNALVSENKWSYRRSNAQGFVITEADAPVYAAQPPAGIFRIVVLGGSTVEGNGASGSLTALPAALLSVLRTDYAPTAAGLNSFEVINAGVSGYTSANELLYYVSELYQLHPHLVISYGAWNDQQINNRVLAQHGSAAPRLATEEYWRYSSIINGHFQWTPAAGNFLIRTAVAAVQAARGFALVDWVFRLARKVAIVADDGAAPPTAELSSPDAVARYADRIRLLNAAVHADGSSHAWFLQPLAGVGNHPPSTFREQPFIDAYPNVVAARRQFFTDARRSQQEFRAAVGEGICAADLTDVFDDLPITVYDDPGHLNDIGNAVVARRIASELEGCGLLSAKRQTSGTGPR